MKEILLVIQEKENELIFYKEGRTYGCDGIQSVNKKDSFRQVLRSLPLNELKAWRVVNGRESCIKDFEEAIQNPKSLYSSQERIVDLYIRLLTKEKIHLEAATVEYGVHRETIKEDMVKIRNIIPAGAESVVAKAGHYFLEKTHALSVSDAFILIQMLYQTNSLNKEEIKEIKNKLFESFSFDEKKQLNNFFRSYDMYYKSMNEHNQIPIIETIFYAVSNRQWVEFHYTNAKGKSYKRKIVPLTVVLHDKMYYLVGTTEIGNYREAKNYRLDRIKKLKCLEDKAIVKDNNFFSSGEFLEESFNMFGGEKVHVKLKIRMEIEEYLLRKVPNAKKLDSIDGWHTYEVFVRGTEGILLWILSQREYVEVLSPQSLRDEMKEIIQLLVKRYDV